MVEILQAGDAGTILKKGSKGPGVVDVMDRLEAQGFDVEITNYYFQKFNTKLEDAVIYFQQTHLGRDGKPLIVDGVVGPATMWALKHPTGKSQTSNLNPLIPRGIEGDRLKVLKVAVAEHAKGVKERPNGSNRSKEIDKYFPAWWMNKHKAARHLAKGLPWCMYFVSWVFKEALGKYPTGRIEGGCSRFAQKAKEREAWWVEDPLCVWPGDIFMILHPKKPGKPQTGHTGIVLRSNQNVTKINTIEGNCGNRVKCGLREVSDITGFIDPFEGGKNQEGCFVRTLVKTKPVASDGTR
jgi:hypothetical protein